MSLATKEPTQRGVFLVSGGIDSAYLLTLGRAYGWEMLALHVSYGQRPAKVEARAAERIADHFGVELRHASFRLGIETPLLGATPPPVRTLEEVRQQERSEFYVPGRNAILLSLAASLAESRSMPHVFFGATAEDTAFPDCQPQFFETLANALPISVRAPLWGMDKASIIRSGTLLGCPFHLTSSCYYGTNCGRCPACLIRAEAFEIAAS